MFMSYWSQLAVLSRIGSLAGFDLVACVQHWPSWLGCWFDCLCSASHQPNLLCCQWLHWRQKQTGCLAQDWNHSNEVVVSVMHKHVHLVKAWLSSIAPLLCEHKLQPKGTQAESHVSRHDNTCMSQNKATVTKVPTHTIKQPFWLQCISSQVYTWAMGDGGKRRQSLQVEEARAL